MNESPEEPNASISNFRNQLHQVSDTFQKLSAEQQSEAVKLIQGLHSTLLSQIYLLTSDPNGVDGGECNQQHFLHNGEIHCQFPSEGSSIDNCNSASILPEKKFLDVSNPLLSHLSISNNSLQQDDNKSKVPSEHVNKLKGAESESLLHVEKVHANKESCNHHEDNSVSSDVSSSIAPNCSQKGTKVNDDIGSSSDNDCTGIKVSKDEGPNDLGKNTFTVEKSTYKESEKHCNLHIKKCDEKTSKDANKSIAFKCQNFTQEQINNSSGQSSESEVMLPNNGNLPSLDDASDSRDKCIAQNSEYKDKKSKHVDNNESLNSGTQSNLNTAGSENAVSCIFCRKEFRNLEEMNEQFCCEEASKLKESGVHYSCNVCGANFSQQHHLQKHLQGHQRNNCQLCNALFTRKKLLCKHMKLVHKISESEKVYCCSFCERKFFKRPSLYTHLKVHANGKLVCTKCGIMNDNEEMHQKHMNKHAEDAKYECDFCNEKFVRRQQYEQHMTGHDRHVCTTCNTNFSTKKKFVKHCQMVHGVQVFKQEKKHECNICKKKFLRPTLLRVHQRVHTGESPIPCAHCDKSFCTKKALAKHMQTESHLKHVSDKEGNGIKLEKPFLCAQCGANFYRSQGLLRHMQQIHGNSEVFECPHCEYKCKCKTNLKRHMELHTAQRRFVCELCGAAFHAFATLKDHNAYVHSETRNFVCEQCGKGFKGRSGLKRHMRIHSDARPYVCHCGQSYKRMSHLKRHMASAHHVVFSSKRVKRINAQDSSDGETNTTFQDATAEFNTAIDGLQDPTCDGFSVMLTSNDNNFMHSSDSCNNSILLDTTTEMERVALTQVNNNSDDYILVSSVKLPPYLDKTNDIQAINENESVILDIVKNNCSVSSSLASLLQTQHQLNSERSSQLHNVASSTVHLQGLDQLAVSSAHFQSLNTSSQVPLSSEETVVTLSLTEPTLHLASHLSSTTELNSLHSAGSGSSEGMQELSQHSSKSISTEGDNLSLSSVQSCQRSSTQSLSKLKNMQSVHHLHIPYQQQLDIAQTSSNNIHSSTDSIPSIMVTLSDNAVHLTGSHSTFVAAKITAMTTSTTTLSASVSGNHSTESSMIKLPSTSSSLHLSDNNHIFPCEHASGLQQSQEKNSLAPHTYIGNECKFLPVIPQ